MASGTTSLHIFSGTCLEHLAYVLRRRAAKQHNLQWKQPIVRVEPFATCRSCIWMVITHEQSVKDIPETAVDHNAKVELHTVMQARIASLPQLLQHRQDKSIVCDAALVIFECETAGSIDILHHVVVHPLVPHLGQYAFF